MLTLTRILKLDLLLVKLLFVVIILMILLENSIYFKIKT